MTPTTADKAREAARNTVLQGLATAAIFGASTGALQALNAGDFTWRTIGTAVATSTVMAVLAFFQHAYAAPYLRIRRASKPRPPR
jgi:hypothetical protein